MSWISHRTVRNHPKIRLFAFPYAGGGPALYRGWPDHLSESVEVIPVHYPGREHRMTESPLETLEELQDGILKTLEPFLDEPYALFGYSMGAVMAFESALRLQEAGRPAPRRIFACASKVPDSQRMENPVHRMDDESLVRTLRNYGGVPEAILNNPEYIQIFFPMIRADFKILENYHSDPSRRVEAPVTAYLATEDRFVERESALRWGEFTSGSFQVREFTGDHFFIFQQEEQLVRALEDDLLS